MDSSKDALYAAVAALALTGMGPFALLALGGAVLGW